jgi:hypothetical protein
METVKLKQNWFEVVGNLKLRYANLVDEVVTDKKEKEELLEKIWDSIEPSKKEPYKTILKYRHIHLN